MKKIQTIIHDVLFLFCFSLVLYTTYYILYTVPSARAQQNLAVQVAPARQELTINPGDTTVFNVRFYNLTDNPIAGIVKTADFIVTGTEGSPRIIDNPAQASPRFAASQWITMPSDRIAIAPNNKVSLQIKIAVPQTANPGGRYVAVYFEPSGPLPSSVGGEQEAATAFAHRIASLVYIRIAGPISENALVSRFFTPSFYEYGPITVATDILNKGDLHIRPVGYVGISNMFDSVVDQKKLGEENIFPDTIRTYSNELGYKWMMGRYKIDLMASYGEGGKALTKSVYIWVFPWRVATVIFLALLILIITIRHIYRTIITKEAKLEKELVREQQELAKLKEELKDQT